MLKNITIRTKITLLIVVISFLVLIAASLFTYQTNIASSKEENSATINALFSSLLEAIFV